MFGGMHSPTAGDRHASTPCRLSCHLCPECLGHRRGADPDRPGPGPPPRSVAAYRHADPAPGGDLPGERLLRSLLRHLSLCPQCAGRAALPRAPVHARGQRARPAALLHAQPEPGQRANGDGAINPFRLSRAQSATADQDHNYAAEQRAFDKGRWTCFPRTPAPAKRCRVARQRAERHGPGDGLLRRQHGHRAVELRPAFRDERQQLQHHASGRPRPVRSTSSPARPMA